MRVALKERSQVCETGKDPCVGEHDSSHPEGDMAPLVYPPMTNSCTRESFSLIRNKPPPWKMNPPSPAVQLSAPRIK
jgi:hypothetical protein